MGVNQNESSCCCVGKDAECSSPENGNPKRQQTPKWVITTVTTPAGPTPLVATRLSWHDRLGSWKARWNINRMNYKIPPGLYGVGNPGVNSVVLMTANYKMTFDRLRQELEGFDAWILVLDTKGINVWCAAGKGTFGTAELVNRVTIVKLAEAVSHRTLILPQLGAPGVSAHEVLKQSGFKVVYGPVRAKDLPAFLQAGQKATPEMRQVTFRVWDRLVLTPMELVATIKPALIVLAIPFIPQLIGDHSVPFSILVGRTLLGFLPFLGAILVGTVLVPTLLPFIPGRSFAWKGWIMGLLWTVIYIWSAAHHLSWGAELMYLLLLPAIASYLAMNFTGSSTYTSLSGVIREMGVALPAIIISAGLGMGIFIVRLFIKF